MFETLESRQMFSHTGVIVAAATRPVINAVLANPNADPNLSVQDSTRLVNGTLYVTGDDFPDRIMITPISGPVMAQSQVKRAAKTRAFSSVNIGGGAISGPRIQVSRDFIIDTFPLSSVKKIVIVGFGGGDVLEVDPTITTPAVIYGGDGDDFIEGGGGNDTISGGAGTDKIFGNGGNDVIYTVSGDDQVFGGAGNDTINGGPGNELLDGGAGNDTIYGQGGNDSIYGGDGNDNLYGGDGNDLIVSVFGGTDTLHGDAGWDTFVADSSDTIYDADSLAINRGSVYRIDKFTNPTTGGAHPVFATDLGTTSIAEPSLTSTNYKYQDFSGTPLFTSQGPALSDVQQNQVNDCWFAATAAGVARSTPWVIERSVVPLGDGTYMVALGNNCYRVDAQLAVDGKGNPVYGNPHRLNGDTMWFPLMEKAVAYYVGDPRNAHYGDIVANEPDTAYNALRVPFDSHTLVSVLGFGTDEDQMWDYINANKGKSMVIDTEPSILGVDDQLVPSHGYTVVDCYSAGTERMVQLRNPWAYNGNHDTDSDGLINVSADDLYSSCDRLYVAN